MKLIDILTTACNLLGMEVEANLLRATTDENSDETLKNVNINRLFELSKFSIQEFCTNYVPITNQTTINTTNKTYQVKNLTNFIRMLNAYKGGESVKYKLINRNLVFDKDGEYTLFYLTYPNLTSLFDELDFLTNLNPDVIVFGLCAYYCLAVGLFSEYEDFHEKYVDKAESLKTLRSLNLPNRRWE